MLCLSRGVMTKLKQVQKSANEFPLFFLYPSVRHGTCVAVQTKRMETDMLCGVMTGLKQVQKSANEFPLFFFCTLQEDQGLCFLQALQNIHLGQLRITFSSPFCVAGVGRSMILFF